MICTHAVHPRVCGADENCIASRQVRPGSPPRVRGRRAPAPVPAPALRFTPACAGQTGFCRNTCKDVGGSPPRVRGRRCDWRSRLMPGRFTPACAGQTCPTAGRRGCARFTPACAGQTLSSLSGSFRPPVHPRVCGADGRIVHNDRLYVGSPPRVRGRLESISVGADLSRFTPACAGQTCSRC